MAVDLQAIVASIERARARGADVVLLSRAMTCPRCGSDALTAPSEVVVDGEHFGARACRRCRHAFRIVVVPSAGLAGALVDAANLAPRPATATADVASRPQTALPPAPSIEVDEQVDEQDDDGRAANVIEPEDIDDAAQVLQGWRVRLAVARSRKRNEDGIEPRDEDLTLLRAVVAAGKAAVANSRRSAAANAASWTAPTVGRPFA